MNLSSKQRTALRTVANREDLTGIHHRTFQSLLNKGLIYRTYGVANDRAHWTLTGPGQVAVANVMASGDGPEDLKAMFRV